MTINKHRLTRKCGAHFDHVITIVSKGILWEEAGTFGWRLTTLKNKVLFQGSGSVDGPSETCSSIRSELGGFTAPLLLVTTLAQHWGLRHRCKFRWLAESKAAINQVRTVIQKDYSPTTQPDNSDYLSTIKVLSSQLRQPITTKLSGTAMKEMHEAKLTPNHNRQMRLRT